MKLDGEKLLADLEYHIERLEEQLDNRGNTFCYASRLAEARLWLNEIKSGDYTIKDKG